MAEMVTVGTPTVYQGKNVRLMVMKKKTRSNPLLFLRTVHHLPQRPLPYAVMCTMRISNK